MAKSIGELVSKGMSVSMAKNYLREAMQESDPLSPAQYMRRKKMTKKPDAARGKTTRIGKIKKIIKGIKDKPSLVGKPGGMSPGAMGGRTKRQLPTPPTVNPRSELENFFKRSDEVATKLGSMMGTAGSAMKKELKKALKEEKDAARPAPFKDGGEVMDLTTEVDVE